MKKALISSFILFCLDRILKELIRYFAPSSLTLIPNFLYLTYTENTGAAFSILTGALPFIIVISFVLLIYLLYDIKSQNEKKIGNYLVLAGLLGNLFDRVFYGYVIDYISFKFASYSFPIFNLADTFIVIGAFLILIDLIRGDKDDIKN